MSKSEAQQVWEEHYADRDRVWSGRVNVRLAEVAESLPPGRALDLGCGEGGDAMWLAERGWHVTAVDISQTALDRAAADARSRDLLERIDFQRHDLPDTFPEGVFDLVSAQFLHSTVELDRPRICCAWARTPFLKVGSADRRSRRPTALGVEAGPPPRVPQRRRGRRVMNLDAGEWERVRVEAVEREATGPDGEVATWTDNVIVYGGIRPGRSYSSVQSR